MLVTQCPRCHESVRVPEAMLAGDGSAQSSSLQAKCPWCLETLDARELGAALPPALVLVGEAAELEAGGSPAGELGEFDELDEMEHFEHSAATDRDRDSQTEEDLSEFAIKEPASVSPARAERPNTKKTPEIMMDVNDRRRKRSGSPIKTMLGVAAGGLLALPIVGVILHFATGQHVPIISDVLPSVAKAKPQLRANVPLQPSNQELVTGDDAPAAGRTIGEEVAQDTTNEAITNQALSEIVGDDPDAMPTLDFGSQAENDLAAVEPSDRQSDPPLAMQPGADESDSMSSLESMSSPEPGENDLASEPALDGLPAAMAEIAMPDPSELPDLPDMTPELGMDGMDMSSSAEPATAQPPAAPEQPAAQPAAAEPPTLDVDSKLQELRASLDEINAMPASDANRAESIQTFYESLARLAGEIPADSVSKLQPLLKDLSSNMGLVVAIAKASPEWIARTPQERDSDGAVVVGKLAGDTPDAATILLSNKQEIPVTLPDSVSEIPSGIQIGLGQIKGSGRDAALTVQLLQPIGS